MSSVIEFAMKKLIFVNRFFYPDHSATSQLLTDLACHLATQNLEVHVVTSRQNYDDPTSQLAVAETIEQVYIHRVWTSRFGRGRLLPRTLDYLTFYATSSLALFRQLKRGDIVIAKTDPPLITVLAATVARLRGATLINWSQDLFPELAEVLDVKGSWIVGGLLRSLRNISFRTAKWNVVLGDRMAERIALEGIPAHSVQVIHNWADGETIRPIDRKPNQLRKTWGLEEKFVVGYSGNMGRAHEFKTILDAAAILRHKEDIRFLFIGSGIRLASIEATVQQQELNNVIFQPYQPRERLGLSLTVPDVHLISLRPALEGLIVPSKFYGIAAAGRPTIYIGDLDGEIPRILKQSTCGYTVSIGNAKELSDRILELSQDTERVTQMGERARAVFDNRYAKRHALAAWQHLLTEI